MGEEEENIIYKLRKSRKAFWVEYLCALFLIGIIIYSSYHTILPPFAHYVLLGMIGVTIFSAELARLFIRYNITSSKVIVIKGFIKQSRKNIYFHSLAYAPEINMSQNRIQRLLHYGKVYVHGGGLAEVFEISDVDSPQEVLKQIEQLVRHTRK